MLRGPWDKPREEHPFDCCYTIVIQERNRDFFASCSCAPGPPRRRPRYIRHSPIPGAEALLRDALEADRSAPRGTHALSGVPGQPNVFYIGFDNGGVWRSTDFGSTWIPLFDNQPTGSIGAIAVAPSDPNVIYVGTGAGIIRPDLATGDGEAQEQKT